jgi:hypothetical protein
LSKYLISASASLEENEEDESAFAIFLKNERAEELKEHISEVFMNEKIPVSLFKDSVDTLLEELPTSDQAEYYHTHFYSRFNTFTHRSLSFCCIWEALLRKR